MTNKELIAKKEECSGCSACVNACPKDAISMTMDDVGDCYPAISRDICIDCRICKKICGNRRNNSDNGRLPACYFGQAKEKTILNSTASGGIFTVLAENFLKRGGIVFGAVLNMQGGKCSIDHQYISRIEELSKLQGSKYVQSNIGLQFRKCKQYLEMGKDVLFSGVPCQIAGLKAYLGRNYENLFLVDLICHGVPSQRLFQKYLDYIQKTKEIEIENISFRDKERGWGFKGKLTYVGRDGKRNSQVWNSSVDSYYRMFLKGEIYRPSCYECMFSSPKREGDITLGDFWGMLKVHPEAAIRNGGCMDDIRGVSCILSNTEKGDMLLKAIDEKIWLYRCSFEDIAKENHQLVRPSKKPEDYEKIQELISNSDYSQLDRYFKKKLGWEYYYRKLVGLIPYAWKNKLRSLR